MDGPCRDLDGTPRGHKAQRSTHVGVFGSGAWRLSRLRHGTELRPAQPQQALNRPAGPRSVPRRGCYRAVSASLSMPPVHAAIKGQLLDQHPAWLTSTRSTNACVAPAVEIGRRTILAGTARHRRRSGQAARKRGVVLSQGGRGGAGRGGAMNRWRCRPRGGAHLMGGGAGHTGRVPYRAGARCRSARSVQYSGRLQDAPKEAQAADARQSNGSVTDIGPSRPWQRRLWPVIAVAIGVLALIETSVALRAPLLAPTDEDWRAAAGTVRAGFRQGDLIVAAPGWADPVLRVHLGDLVPLKVAARMDSARYARIWEIGQRGGRAPEATGARLVSEAQHGALTVRLMEKNAATVSYDFVERWAEGRASRSDGRPLAAPLKTAEVDTTIRRGIYVEPVERVVTAIEFPAVPLGRELVIATGLHNVWARKYDTGTVDLRVFVDGSPVLQVNTANNDGWKMSRIDTGDRAGQTARVRFEVSSLAPRGRHFILAAEARS